MSRSVCALTGALTVLSLSLAGCAYDRERTAWTDWSELDASFRPMNEEVAPLTSASTLTDYVALALRRNPALQAQSQRWRADLERVPQARSLPDPELTYGGFIEQVETRVGPQRIVIRYEFRFTQEDALVYLGDQTAIFVRDKALE